jgi:hypothetical protein
MDRDGIEEESKDGVCAVVIVGLDAHYQSTLAIDEPVDYYLPSDQAYSWVSLSNAGIIR